MKYIHLGFIPNERHLRIATGNNYFQATHPTDNCTVIVICSSNEEAKLKENLSRINISGAVFYEGAPSAPCRHHY